MNIYCNLFLRSIVLCSVFCIYTILVYWTIIWPKIVCLFWKKKVYKKIFTYLFLRSDLQHFLYRGLAFATLQPLRKVTNLTERLRFRKEDRLSRLSWSSDFNLNDFSLFILFQLDCNIFGQPIFSQCYISVHPENVRKPSDVFRGYRDVTLGEYGLKRSFLPPIYMK